MDSGVISIGNVKPLCPQCGTELMIEHGIGVAEEHSYNVKKIDSDYFEEG